MLSCRALNPVNTLTQSWYTESSGQILLCDAVAECKSETKEKNDATSLSLAFTFAFALCSQPGTLFRYCSEFLRPTLFTWSQPPTRSLERLGTEPSNSRPATTSACICRRATNCAALLAT